MSKIPPPHTYSEWVAVLDVLKNRTDDMAALEAMKNGSLEWQTGVAERFMRKFGNTIEARTNEVLDRCSRELRQSSQERVVVQATLSLRKEFRFLCDVANIPALPERERKQVQYIVRENAKNAQKSLEDSAKADRTGKLASIIRTNRVDAI